jgi:hypothetical protein
MEFEDFWEDLWGIRLGPFRMGASYGPHRVRYFRTSDSHILSIRIDPDIVGVLGTKAFSANIRTIMWGTFITLAFGFCKEFVFDHLVEQDSWREDAKDFLFISLGVILAWAAIGLSYIFK